MDYKIVNLDEIKIIGINKITTNRNNQAMSDIPAVIGKFYGEGFAEKIPSRIDNDMLAIYTDYEKDYTAPYNYIYGCRVSSVDFIPEGMIGKIIPASKYAVFAVRGKMPDVIVNLWKYIWKEFDSQRAYIADFEVYGKKSQDRENSEIEVYISIK
ncbi:MAG: effector binding domain-containing protein [Bacteroidetes bacterium]|nr:effector binding domain-containing protein [Bacteroidota bacterium]